MIKRALLTAGLIIMWMGWIPGHSPANAEEAPLPDTRILKTHIEAMKEAPRGPFSRIRWFCRDGTIHPPKPYPCEERGGGVQHGEWSDRTKALRAKGYHIASVLADTDAGALIRTPEFPDILRQMILEQFLINADDGWIYRQARYYRGALQAEDEEAGGRELLLALVQQKSWREDRFPVLREAVRFLPHGRDNARITRMRQLSRAMGERDPEFNALRIKLHVRPDADDARAVRDYAARSAAPEDKAEYAELAGLIDAIYRTDNLVAEMAILATRLPDPSIAEVLTRQAARLVSARTPEAGLEVMAGLLRFLRDHLHQAGSPALMLAFLDISLGLEDNFFRVGSQLAPRLKHYPRRTRLRWLGSGIDALRGVGLISGRQRSFLNASLRAVTRAEPLLAVYKGELDYLARVPGWADRFHSLRFSRTVDHLAAIEPLTRRYLHDRLHTSPLLFYTAVIDTLLTDADRLTGVSHTLFGQKISGGLRGLNPGLARGILRFAPEPPDRTPLARDGIYVLPATTDALTPVAGIITAGEGNALSHVQLLARNLGIPNVASDRRLLSRLEKKAGEPVVLAVSPGGVVRLAGDGPEWESLFKKEKQSAPDMVIRPDLNKIDLTTRRFFSLADLRASDSGRICGPKAANLGELKHHFPQAVTEGVVIPFGVYRALLDRPFAPGGPSIFEWMKGQYAAIGAIPAGQARQNAESRFLEEMRNRILSIDSGPEFRRTLARAMKNILGEDGTYGVFVRSDTNVEDLSGFTGAGLNLTVPHVVGFDNIIRAISRVWASPFAERAFRWRQGHMEGPEHVYCSVLLMKSVPADKSGVMVTADLANGNTDTLYVAVNRGVGGAVAGQRSEELRIDLSTGKIRLMAQATEPLRRVLLPKGGLKKIPAGNSDSVLEPDEILRLIRLARSVPEKFPRLRNNQGEPVPADIEFGFYNGDLVLFQIRPFLENRHARRSLFLHGLDKRPEKMRGRKVDLDEVGG
ncbi:phosphoenolpyruvate synthase [Desulfonema ishimotonii]|uniref:Phosphoenolpyruvate synthase n=1 Tax=Desulfonema ishimotonii TaxID=45657 RepID=A0A401FTZ7_9BACT|nr:PEP/pyruvate-binding domain-containing protein [Desulfonema ishimotonii]GBC60433.1 phosphoenolpyruvate synthase [Desulfonema ishimotonii]